MDSSYEKRLEQEIDRELKGLRELRAPEALVGRVLRAIAQPVCLPWYRRSWQTWPMALQSCTMALLLVFLAALCFGAWELTQSAVIPTAAQRVAGWFSGLSAVWGLVNTLAGLLVLCVKQLGTAVLIAAVVAAGLAWAGCVGIGALYVRFAFARR